MNSEPFQARDIFHSLISENKKKIENDGKEDDSTA